MNRLKRNVAVLGILGLLAFVAIAWASQATSVMLKPLPDWTNELVVKESELPSGWTKGGSTWYDMLGMPARLFSFENPQAGQVEATLSEEFVVYSTTVLAQQAYPHVLDMFFPPAYTDQWKTIPELAFQHHADQMKTACLSITINSIPDMDCTSIARYQNLIVLTHGLVFKDQWLTLVDYRKVLEAVDGRTIEVLSK